MNVAIFQIVVNREYNGLINGATAASFDETDQIVHICIFIEPG